MKKIQILQLLLLFISVNAVAQNGRLFREKRNQIKTMKIAFITSELALTEDEATKFWPIYNIFETKQQNLRKQKLKGYLDATDENAIDNLSEKESATLLVQMENAEDEVYQNKKNLVSSLKNVISPTKILKLKKAEEEFNKKMLQQFKNNRR